MTDTVVKVSSIRKTCYACPAQWEGLTDDGRHVYVRYRWGWLTVQVASAPGKGIDYLRGPFLVEQRLGDDLDGTLSYDDLRFVTKDVLEWPTYELPEVQ